MPHSVRLAFMKRRRDLVYSLLVHALAVVGLIALFGWANEARSEGQGAFGLSVSTEIR
ncbi:MAG: hypothetical protein K2X61_14940 [Caulobacteraceae bacterium]|nr:hypothetical protein [Caulobacteraceae bacterium]